MKLSFFAATLFLPLFAMAGPSTYKVSGMTCGSCVKAVKAKVCKLEGVEKCEVTIGKVILTAKPGVTLDDKMVSAAVEKAGEYKVTDTVVPDDVK